MAYTLDTSAQLVAQTGTSISLSYTPGTGTTVLVLGLSIVGVTARAGGAPTFAGITMTQAGTTQISTSTTCQSELWYLIDPPVGAAANIVVPNTGALNVTLVASSYKTAPGLGSVLDTTAQGAAAGTGNANPSLATAATPTSVTTSVAGCVIVGICSDGGGTLGVGTGYTSLFSGTNSTIRYGGEYLLSSVSGANAMAWTNATSARWTINAVAFRETSRNNGMLMGTGT